MKRISITKGKNTLHYEDFLREKRRDRRGLDEKRKFGDERCGLDQRGMKKYRDCKITLARAVVVREEGK